VKIDIQNIPQVALGFMNSDHKAFVDIFNTLADLLAQSSRERHEVSALLEQLLEHSREHFAREEQQMIQFSFPAYSCHKSEHEQVLVEMEKELDAWRAAGDVQWLNDYLEQLPEWLAGHIASMDTVTANYISQMGGPVELA